MAKEDKTPAKTHDFEVNGGNQPKNGKFYWPDHLTIIMNKQQAWALVNSIMEELQIGRKTISYPVLGKLDYDIGEI